MKYFKLLEECYLVSGEKESAIYNILSGDVFIVNSVEKELLAQTESNIPVIEACEKIGLKIETAKAYLNNLIEAKLGKYAETPLTVEKLELLPKWMEKIFFKLPPVINRATIEIGNRCDLSCDFCGSKSKINKMKCLSCNGDGNNEFIELNMAYEIIDILAIYNCKQIYIKGGNLLLDWNKVKKIVEYAIKTGINNIVLNIVSSIKDNEIIEYIKEKKITLMVQKYIKEEFNIWQLFDEVKIYEGINVTYLFLADYRIKNDVYNLYKSLTEHNFQNIMFDFFVPNDRELVPKEYIKDLSRLQRVSMESISISKKYNPCFFQSCFFDNEGNIYPCSGLREFMYGNINNISATFKEENLNKYWKLNKDSLSECKSCELRYACDDCRGLTYALTNDLDRNIFCIKK